MLELNRLRGEGIATLLASWHVSRLKLLGPVKV